MNSVNLSKLGRFCACTQQFYIHLYAYILITMDIFPHNAQLIGKSEFSLLGNKELNSIARYLKKGLILVGKISGLLDSGQGA